MTPGFENLPPKIRVVVKGQVECTANVGRENYGLRYIEFEAMVLKFEP